MSKPISGLVFDIKKFAVHDGPGIRTTVFLKGCPLRCLWCHNPQSVAGSSQLAYDEDKCIHCGACVDVCPENCHGMPDGKHAFDRTKCTACGSCVPVCLGNALEMIGERKTVDEVLTEVLKDIAYYENSGGGMTLSGGEPMVQPAFTQALLAAAKDEGIHTCLDTCGQVKFEQYTKVIGSTDLIHYDYKETDPVRHKEYTGHDNILILENLRKLDMYGKDIVLRCPVIPGLNDREDHFKAVAALGDELKSVKRIDLMPYHPFGGKENEKIGQDAPIKGIEAVKEEQAEEWIQAMQKFTEKEVKRG